MGIYKRRLVTINAHDGLDLAHLLRRASLANLTASAVNIE
jgi:hypothetical protein